jgi:hypothetical protein
MHIEIPEALVPQIVHAFAANPALRSFVKAELLHIAAELKEADDLLSAEKAAALLGITKRTLQDNHRAWGLDKSVAFGLDKPFFFRSQILRRAKEKVMRGRAQELRAA